MAAVHAALVSILNQITFGNHPILDVVSQETESLVKNFTFLLGLLKDEENPKTREAINLSKARIVKAAHNAQDTIESLNLSSASSSRSELQKVVEEVDQLVIEVRMKKEPAPITPTGPTPFQSFLAQRSKDMKFHKIGYRPVEQVNPALLKHVSDAARYLSQFHGKFPARPEQVPHIMQTFMTWKFAGMIDDPVKAFKDSVHIILPTPSAPDRIKNTVGLDEDMKKLKELMRGSSSLQVISIVGMGGIGKTALANNIFYDPLIEQEFHCRSWVTITPSYGAEDIVRALINSNIGITEKPRHETQDQLRKSLKRRKFLIVLDDMWRTEKWDSVRSLFPNDNNGSRIILTTRLEDVAAYAAAAPRNIHRKEYLNEDHSWELLENNVFPEEEDHCCPAELEEIGKDIARTCRGHALSILVIAGLLSKEKENRNHWEKISRDVTSAIVANDENSTSANIMLLSYNNLPHHLKPCFLYFGLFPEEYQIPVFKIISMWVAEGFVKPDAFRSLEQVAEEYFQELVRRNLVLVIKRSYSGKSKLSGLHDLLRNLCQKKAVEEDFIHVVQNTEENMKDKFHIRIAGSDVLDHIRNADADAISGVRSVFCSIFNGEMAGFKHLRVLDVLHVSFNTFPCDILRLAHLRYLCFSSGFIGHFRLPHSLSQLENLETLIIRLTETSDNVEAATSFSIWKMPQLRHLHILPEVNLSSFPFPSRSDEELHALENFQTLSVVSNFKFTNEAISMIPNLRKLKTLCRCESLLQISELQLNNLALLNQLSTLNLKFIYPSDDFTIPFKFPPNLTKLTLSGCRISWSAMSRIGLLPNLQILKLRSLSVTGEQWESVEGEFSKLKVLLMECLELKDWLAESSNFPSLEHLIIRHCSELECIPLEIGEIPTLQLIEVHNSQSAAASAKDILSTQRDDGNEILQVRISGDETLESNDGAISDELESESKERDSD